MNEAPPGFDDWVREQLDRSPAWSEAKWERLGTIAGVRFE